MNSALQNLEIPEVPFVVELETRSLINLSIASILVALAIVIIIRKI